MVGNSKILTVSYGTFACTLEGFDDSFDTMKAIAEYFRDLAADDRYFGAVPPTPDAEMLTRIAEREIARRVEAHHSEGQIHLRASPALPAVAPPEQAITPAQPPQPERADPPAEAAFHAMTSLPEVVAPHTRYGDTDSITDKLRRIRAVVAPGASAFPSDDLSETADRPDFPDEAETDAAPPLEDTAPLILCTDDQTIEAPSGDLPDAIFADPSDSPQADHCESEISETADTGPDQPEPAAPSESAADHDALAALLRSAAAFDAAMQEEADEPDTTAAETPAADHDILAHLLSDAMDGATASGPEPIERADAPGGTESPQISEADPEPASQPWAARVIKLKRPVLDALLAAGTLPDAWRKLSNPPEQQNPPPAAVLTDTPAPTDDAPQARHPGLSASDAQATRIFDEADTQLDRPQSGERRNAIQHLRAAVAATRAEQHAGGIIQTNIDDRPYRADLQKAVHPSRPPALITPVTPRPTTDSHPVPLTLVAEQRIDTPIQPVRPRRITSADLITLAELRRDTAAQPIPLQTGHTTAGGLFDFTQEMGASSLIERLEAAAAYMTDMEGIAQFTRSMLIQKLHEAYEGAVPREESLHAFGQLLRRGKLQKLKGGWFSVSTTTGFRDPAAVPRSADS